MSWRGWTARPLVSMSSTPSSSSPRPRSPVTKATARAHHGGGSARRRRLHGDAGATGGLPERHHQPGRDYHRAPGGRRPGHRDQDHSSGGGSHRGARWRGRGHVGDIGQHVGHAGGGNPRIRSERSARSGGRDPCRAGRRLAAVGAAGATADRGDRGIQAADPGGRLEWGPQLAGDRGRSSGTGHRPQLAGDRGRSSGTGHRACRRSGRGHGGRGHGGRGRGPRDPCARGSGTTFCRPSG